jgi:predicted PurR-regulated permease PerM
MGVWLIILFVADNIIKPILIAKSGKLPILVLFFGVIGGMSAWGFTGMFKGAVVLAVMYTIFKTWTRGNATALAVDENAAPAKKS